MDNYFKHSMDGWLRLQVVVAVLTAALAFGLTAGATPAAADSAPPQNPGCETYGCLYEHCPTNYSRPGQGHDCEYGIAYQRLPDGPDNRRFVRVMWPGHYNPGRRAMWDDVAYCESTWRWSINNGNGFHGGVQFHPRTWTAYGGGEFAPYAHQALPEQQIAVAERVAYYGYTRADGTPVSPQGPGAWPRCGRHLQSPA